MTKRSRRPGGRPESDAATPPAAAPSPTARSRSASGTPRAGRRDRPVRRYQTRSFFDRYRTPLLIAFGLAGLLLIGVFAFAPRTAYACDVELTPGPSDPIPSPTAAAASGSPSASPSGSPSASPSDSPSPSPAASASASASPSGSAAASPSASASASTTPAASPSSSASPAASPSASASPAAAPTQRVGFAVEDLGNTHVSSSGNLRYEYCPPASGPHFNIRGQGPIPRNFYGPGTESSPGGWVHNLEHGFVVFAYSCRDGCPPQETLDQIRAAMDAVPQTEGAVACGIPNKVVTVRFDQMSTKFAAIAWDRVMLTDTWDSAAAQRVAEQWIDSGQTPERGACDR